MNATFVGKGAFADVGQILAMVQVGQLAYVVGHLREALEAFPADAAHAQLQLDIGDH
jgi:hypothetical protein